MIKLPPSLKPGATIGVVGPASPMIEERLQKGIFYLENEGFAVKLGKSARQVYGYLAGSDQSRADDLNSMFLDPEVNAIFCTRGGYGTPRILDLIDYDAVAKNPKILVGYSDITALQMAIFSQANLVTFSGPMVAVEMGKGIDKFTENHFWSMLANAPFPYRLTADAERFPHFPVGTAEGILMGGNLAMLAALVGTQYLPSLENAILVIEDIGDEPYQIDRNLTQLRLSGLLDKLSGLVLGRFTDCEPSSKNSLTLEQIILDVTGHLNLPTLTHFPYGHIDRKYTLPFGVPVFLNADEGYLEIATPPVV